MSANLEGTGWKVCTCKLFTRITKDGVGDPNIMAADVTNCAIHDLATNDAVRMDNTLKVFEYSCCMVHNNEATIEKLVGVSAGHAFEEASHEFQGVCIAVKRGKFMHLNN